MPEAELRSAVPPMKASSGFLAACRSQPVDCTPVWLMRQAGRALPEYRALRDRFSFLQLCKNPELAAEATLQPVRALKVDAAILFFDILLPLEALGLRLDFTPAPVLEAPVRTAQAVADLRTPRVARDLPFLAQSVRMAKEALGQTPLIGFCGAPLTLACYLVEGGGSADFSHALRMMREEPALWNALLDKLTDLAIDTLAVQAAAGAQALQIFDTWAQLLDPEDYFAYVLPHTRRLVEAVRGSVPVLFFLRGGAPFWLRECGADVISVDESVTLAQARKTSGGKAVQGNLAPGLLKRPLAELEGHVRRVLTENEGALGHIFNLGHGVPPDTPVENLRFVVESVHRLSAGCTVSGQEDRE